MIDSKHVPHALCILLRYSNYLRTLTADPRFIGTHALCLGTIKPAMKRRSRMFRVPFENSRFNIVLEENSALDEGHIHSASSKVTHYSVEVFTLKQLRNLSKKCWIMVPAHG